MLYEVITLPAAAHQMSEYILETTPANRFATLIALRLAPDGSYRAVNAGHCPGIVVRAGVRPLAVAEELRERQIAPQRPTVHRQERTS